MTTNNDERPVAMPELTPEAAARSPAQDDGRKRKASPAQEPDDGSIKRARQERDQGQLPPSSARSASPKSGRQASAAERERRASIAKQEEKKRGQRLFGGLLSTLSQTTSNSQQRRRQEIERRQLDKIQQQTAEEDKQRTEQRAALHKIRMQQQITWEEQVMRSRHAKELKLAQFLRTESRPEVYFLPWKLTRREEDTIEDQVRDCKATIARELEDFKWRKEQHVRRLGPRRQSDATVASPPAAIPAPERHASPPRPPAASPGPTEGEKKTTVAHHDGQDDSGDFLVDAEEDMVIY
ncbi:hypothetical protein CDD83_11053 [Cordyceps sp. RAO-2017]|nr:hypothetical protein CDD83_11053 [Cordyceps sp. RAO-2017]